MKLGFNYQTKSLKIKNTMKRLSLPLMAVITLAGCESPESQGSNSKPATQEELIEGLTKLAKERAKRFSLSSIKGEKAQALSELEVEIVNNLFAFGSVEAVSREDVVSDYNFSSRDTIALMRVLDNISRSAATKNGSESLAGNFNIVERLNCLYWEELDVDTGHIDHTAKAKVDFAKNLESVNGKPTEKADFEFSTQGVFDFKDCKSYDEMRYERSFSSTDMRMPWEINSDIYNLEASKSDLWNEPEILEEIDQKIATLSEELRAAEDFENLLYATVGESLLNRSGKLEYSISSVMNLTSNYDDRESIFDMPLGISERSMFQKAIEEVSGNLAGHVALKGNALVQIFNEESQKIESHRVRSNLEIAFKGEMVDLYDLVSLPFDPILSKEDKRANMQAIADRVITCSGNLQFGNDKPIECANLVQGLIEDALNEALETESSED